MITAAFFDRATQFLSDHPGCTAVDLCDHLGCDMADVRELLDAATRAGAVEIVRSQEGQRLLFPTRTS